MKVHDLTVIDNYKLEYEGECPEGFCYKIKQRIYRYFWKQQAVYYGKTKEDVFNYALNMFNHITEG